MTKLTKSQRAELISLLTGASYARLTSWGCGSRTKLAYRMQNGAIVGKDGRVLEGIFDDDLLLAHCRAIADLLKSLIISIGRNDEEFR